MKRIHAALVAAALAAVPALAEPNVVGKYSGSYTRTTREGDAQVGVTLEIREAAGGKVKGTVRTIGARSDSGSGGCDGTFAVEGTLVDNTLRLRTAEKGGPAKDCWFTVALMVDGNRLVGKTAAGRPLRLSK